MRKNRFIFLLALTSPWLAACGAKTLGNPNATKNPGTKDNNTKFSCAGAQPTVEAVTLTFAHAAPTAIAVKFPNETTYHLDECKRPAQAGMLVSASRPIANALQIGIDLNHTTDANGHTILPSHQAFEVFDLHNCDGSAATSIFSSPATNPVPLDWQLTYPNGNTCAPQTLGTYNQLVAGFDGAGELR